MTSKKLLFVMITTLATMRCGSKSSDDTTTTAPSGLSTTFTGTCAASGCHANGGATAPAGTSKILKGTTLTADEFKSKVRNGSGTTMAAYGTTSYSDADLAADYALLKK